MAFLQIKGGAVAEPTGEVTVTVGFPADKLAHTDLDAIQSAGWRAVEDAMFELRLLKRG